MEALRQKYKSALKIIKGIEVGIQLHVIEKTLKIVDNYPFDFVIASIHAVDKKDHIGYKFEYFKHLLIESGFKYLTHFIDRKPVFTRLS